MIKIKWNNQIKIWKVICLNKVEIIKKLVFRHFIKFKHSLFEIIEFIFSFHFFYNQRINYNALLLLK
jgi:hypothetical protein